VFTALPSKTNLSPKLSVTVTCIAAGTEMTYTIKSPAVTVCDKVGEHELGLDKVTLLLWVNTGVVRNWNAAPISAQLVRLPPNGNVVGEESEIACSAPPAEASTPSRVNPVPAVGVPAVSATAATRKEPVEANVTLCIEAAVPVPVPVPNVLLASLVPYMSYAIGK
jgi:hypothetical protein